MRSWRYRWIRMRAVLGCSLIAVSLLGAWWLRDRPAGRHAVLAASDNFAHDHPLTPGDLIPVQVDLPPAQLAILLSAGELDSVIGGRLLRPVASGELLTRMTVGAGPTSSGYTVEIPATTFAGELRTGDRIDVIATWSEKGGTTDVVAAGVVVTNVLRSGQDASGQKTLHIGLDGTQDQLLDIEHAQQTGTVRVVRAVGTYQDGSPDAGGPS